MYISLYFNIASNSQYQDKLHLQVNMEKMNFIYTYRLTCYLLIKYFYRSLLIQS